MKRMAFAKFAMNNRSPKCYTIKIYAPWNTLRSTKSPRASTWATKMQPPHKTSSKRKISLPSVLVDHISALLSAKTQTISIKPISYKTFPNRILSNTSQTITSGWQKWENKRGIFSSIAQLEYLEVPALLSHISWNKERCLIIWLWSSWSRGEIK